MSEREIQILTIRLPASVNAKIEEIARAKGISKNALISQVLADYTSSNINSDTVVEDFERRLQALEKEVFKKK